MGYRFSIPVRGDCSDVGRRKTSCVKINNFVSVKYTICLNTREFEIIAQGFDFDLFYNRGYDQERMLGLTREAWLGNVPLYLHDVGVFDADYLSQRAANVVTCKPIFDIFDKKNLTFIEMLQEIQACVQKIAKQTPGDDNPYG
jgi:hypothetical protein